MLYVLHGEDTNSVIQKLDEFIGESSWTVRLDAKESGFEEFEASFEEDALFSEKKVLVFTNIMSLGSKNVERFLLLLNTHAKHDDLTIIVWQTSDFDKKFLAKVKKAKVFAFPLPKNFFTFLDSVVPQNGKKLHVLLESVSRSFSTEQIFYALVKRVRILMILKTGKIKDFADTKMMGDWQLSKLKTQASHWREEDLIVFYQKLFETELALKTSNLSANLFARIDILLLTAL